MFDRTNSDRARIASAALRAASDDNDPETNVSDLVCNLIHYCDRVGGGIDFDACIDRGRRHYVAEIEEDSPGDWYPARRPFPNAPQGAQVPERQTHAARSLDAIEAARMAFWSTLAKHYPEATAGDSPACAVDAFEQTTMSVGSRWIADNVPPRRYAVATVHVITGDNPTDAWETFTTSDRAAGAVFVTGPCDLTVAQATSEDFDVDVRVGGATLARSDES